MSNQLSEYVYICKACVERLRPGALALIGLHGDRLVPCDHCGTPAPWNTMQQMSREQMARLVEEGGGK